MATSSTTPSRRQLLRALAGAGAVLGLAACGGTAEVGVTTSAASSVPAATSRPAVSSAAPSSTTASVAPSVSSAASAASSVSTSSAPAGSASASTSASVAAATSQPTGKGAALTFLIQEGQDSQQRYQAMLDLLKQSDPNLQVQLQGDAAGGSAVDVQAKLLITTAANTPPDLYWVHVYTAAGIAKLGIPQDLGPNIARDTAFRKDDYFPASLTDYQLNGKQYGLPRETTSTVLVYNKTLMDRNGVGTPQASWTWDDFVAAAQQLTKGDGDSKTWGTANWHIPPYAYYTYIRDWQEGGDVVSSDRTQFTLGDDAGIRAITWVQDLFHKYKVYPTADERGKLSDSDLFVAGRIGMMPTISVYSTFQTKAQFEFDIQHLPHAATQVTRTASAGHSIHSKTKFPDQAWTVLKAVESQASFEHMAKLGLTLPAFKAVAASPLVLNPNKPPKSANIGVEAMAYARSEPVAGDWVGVHGAVAKALGDIFGPSKADPKTQMESIKSPVEQLLAKTPQAPQK